MRKTIIIALAALAAFAQFSSAQLNPIVRDIYTADPSARVWADGRLYVYPSHDMEPPRGCDLMDKYHVYSTDDMVHWIDHGQILEAGQVPWASPLADGGKFMWAPDCIYRNGKYYFYFPHPKQDPWNSTWQIGIAVSDKPASDFAVLDEPLKGIPDNGEIDPCIFIDDDNQAYFYYGGGGHCYGAKLKENMIELDGPLQAMTGLSDFHEGTWVFKRKDNYYLTYADGNGTGGNQLRYAMSASPLGPWQYKGVYLRPTGCPTSHGSVVEYKGQWWAFYHNQALSNRGELRSICVDKLFFYDNDRIMEVKQTKDIGTPYGDVPWLVPGTIEAEDYNEGRQGLAYYDATQINSGGAYREEEPVDIDENRNGDIYVTNTVSGEYTNYTFDVKEEGIYAIHFIMGNPIRDFTARFYLEFDQNKTTNPVRYDVPYTGSRFQTVIVDNISLTKGIHVMTFYPLSDLNFDKFTFINTTTDISKVEPDYSISVYQESPAGIFRVKGLNAGILSVSDVSGKRVLKKTISLQETTVDLSAQAPGIYILTIQGNKQVYWSKLIKR